MFHEFVREARKPPQVITREIPDFPKRILTAAWIIPRGTRVRVDWTAPRKNGARLGIPWAKPDHASPPFPEIDVPVPVLDVPLPISTNTVQNQQDMDVDLKRKKFQLFQGCQVLHRYWGRPPDWIPNLNQVVCLLFPRIRWNQLLHLQSLQSVYRLMIAVIHLGKILRRGTTPPADPI